ncbi:hypothetical protein GCM10010191_20640 [Actinomadura vinacea]|uniref:Uncharacterized protein n=1 Tax=Actinomadura vinacea TaxID=115336 RepID=A0ABP5VX57_9ACTN
MPTIKARGVFMTIFYLSRAESWGRGRGVGVAPGHTSTEEQTADDRAGSLPALPTAGSPHG